jgi:hypothetical protein
MTNTRTVQFPDKASGLPILPIPSVYLLHGKGGSPEGTVRKLQDVLEQHWPGLDFIRPLMPHHDPASPASASIETLLCMNIPKNSLILGVSLGGLVAAKLQECGRDDLQVIAISSPTWADDVMLESRSARRLAFYSSADSVIASRVGKWPELAGFSRDFDWLTHDTDAHMKHVARVFDWYLQGILPRLVDQIRNESSTQQERDEIVWRVMAEPHDSRCDWNAKWRGRRPRDYAEIGLAMQSGQDWYQAWGNWLHEFVLLKDSRCLAAEPPDFLHEERRAMLAGVAEFFARLYGLSKPDWVEKPEYFLSGTGYCAIMEDPDDIDAVVMIPINDDHDFRKRAKTPKEMLRRNVVFEARGLTVL